MDKLTVLQLREKKDSLIIKLKELKLIYEKKLIKDIKLKSNLLEYVNYLNNLL